MEDTLPPVMRTPDQVYRDWRYYREFGSQVAQYGTDRPVNGRVEQLTKGVRELLHTAFDRQVVQGDLPTAEGLQSLKEILAQRSTTAAKPTKPGVNPSIRPPQSQTIRSTTPLTKRQIIGRSISIALLVGIILGVFWLLWG